MATADGFGEDLADFVHRISELKTARGVPEGDLPAVLDAAIFELDHVASRLWPRYEQLATGGAPTGDRQEQQLLKAMFQRFPLPVVLVDREAVVRRMNFAATGLTGVRAGYATGRPFTGFLTYADRAAFRSQAAAVARGEGDRSLTVRLQQSQGPRVRATLTALRPTNEPRIVVLVALQPEDGLSAFGPGPSGSSPTVGGRVPDLSEAAQHAELSDLMDTVTTALLTAPADDPAAVLERTAGALHGRFADWVVAETGAARLRRTVVLGPEDAGDLADALAKQEPAGCPLVVEAARGGSMTLQVRPEDTEALGLDASGDPVLVRADVTSLLCVPLTDPRDGVVQGVLTLLRTGPRLAFSMAEARTADMLSRQLALAMRRKR